VSANRIVGLSNGKARVTTRLPHRLTVGLTLDFSGDTSNNYNGSFEVSDIDDDYTFRIALDSNKSEVSTGRPEFYVQGWSNAIQRCGIMDDQNGMFFEYDGQTLFACKRSSTKHIGGTSTVTFGESAVFGQNTQYNTELVEGDMIVIKGQSYKVVDIAGPTLLHVQPSYRGVSSTNVVVSKTKEQRVAQQNWSIDPCDGTGKFGYKLKINKIQMVYIDYAWYGAGKVRFGFKDQFGDVIYVHEFIHNNFETEAYLRSGNLPGRYEVEIGENPTFIPSLAHWGTSVIMDGGFDDDKAYLFSATSNPVFTTSAEPTTIAVTTVSTTNFNTRSGVQLGDGIFFAFDITGNLIGEIGFALQVGTHNDVYFGIASGNQIVNTVGGAVRVNTLTTTPTNGRVGSSPYLRQVIVGFNTDGTPIRRNLLVIDKVPANRTTTGATVSVTNNFDFTQFIPLLSVRLAPSVDNGTPGKLGAREIINRMQLTLNSLDFLSTHECEIQLVFNASIDNQDYRRVQSPSLSEVVYHSLSDKVFGGAVVYTFQTPSGGQQASALNTSQRELALTTVKLEDVATLGNSIVGGNGVFPDGPDVITLQFRYIGLPGLIGPGTAGTAIAPFRLSTRLSWSESQA
jgi:hypothetical protein